MPSNFHKPVQSVISTRKETLAPVTIGSSGFTAFLWTLVTRADLASWETNFTSSFNLPFERDAFSSASTLSLAYPELQQLNTESFLLGVIHPDHYSEMIDGRSVVVTVPGTSTPCISSTYNVLAKSEDNALLGKNIAFLFNDSINRPYTGTTDGGSNSRAAVFSWSASSYLDRPAAVSYQNLQATDIYTDQRPTATINRAVRMPFNYPTNTNQGYNYDIPVGFVALDKGFVVITHPAIVTAVTWTGGLLVRSTITSNAGGDTTNIGWATGSGISFYDVDVEYKTTVVTTALPGEFYFSCNPTWDFQSNLDEYQLGSNNFTTTYVTEIGLYNRNDELIAIAKLDRPKEKGYTGVLTFSLQIDV